MFRKRLTSMRTCSILDIGDWWSFTFVRQRSWLAHF